MISILLLSFILTASEAARPPSNCSEVPNCSSCDYNDGIGFVKSKIVCVGYFVCYKEPSGGYFHEFMCCPLGMTFDEDHLTCVIDDGSGTWTDKTDKCCPNITTPSAVECPMIPYAKDNHYFVMPGGKVLPCPMSEVWDQDACSCVRGPSFVPNDYCCKILHFTFNGTYDSYSCYNFAKGEPLNYPSVNNNVLCLDGNKSQSVAVPFLDNWFAWNPLGKTFTICFWLCPKYANQTSGVFSTNCDFSLEGSVFEVCLENGQLAVVVGPTAAQILLPRFPPRNKFSKVCITFDNGNFVIYYNGWPIHFGVTNPMPVNSHSATSLGFVEGKPYFSGYLDDFCFWTKALSASKIKDCYKKGPSNTYKP